MLTLARLLANCINPALAALLLAAPFLEQTRVFGSRSSSPSSPTVATLPYPIWLLRCLSGVGVAVLLAETGKRMVVWPGHPLFPSGHETFAASAAACLVFRQPRWAVVAIPVALIMAWALVRAGFHDVPDVIGGLTLGATVAALARALIRPRTTATLPNI